MKKISFALVLILALVTLCGCEGYVNKYMASYLVTSCLGNEADMEFKSFDGVYNLRLRRDGVAEHTLDYEASLAEGEMNVYIGIDGDKELLFTIKGGESLDAKITLDSKYDEAEKIYIILESEGKCSGGDFEFEYD